MANFDPLGLLGILPADPNAAVDAPAQQAFGPSTDPNDAALLERLFTQPQEGEVPLERPGMGVSIARALADALQARAGALNPNVRPSNFTQNARRLQEFRRRERQQRADKTAEREAGVERGKARVEQRRREVDVARLDRKQERAEDVALGDKRAKEAEQRAIEAEERGHDNRAALLREEFRLRGELRDSEPEKPDPQVADTRAGLMEALFNQIDGIEANGLGNLTGEQIANQFMRKLRILNLPRSTTLEMIELFNNELLPVIEAAESSASSTQQQGQIRTEGAVESGLQAGLPPALGAGSQLFELLFNSAAQRPEDAKLP